MSSIILHHFEASPFSEKVRALLGYKSLSWQSVLIPRILPKPDLVALTGGYRKTPVMQIGRDIYCDTRLIARTIETHAPNPPAIPAADTASVVALERFADRQLFLAAVPAMFRPAGRAFLVEKMGEDGLARFQADRAELFASGNVARPDAAFSEAVLPPSLAALDTQLAARDFLLGAQPTLADFAVYHPVWYIRANAGIADLLDPYRHLLAWADRVRALGHGHREELDAAQAHAIAAQTTDWQPLPEPVEHKLAPGTAVTVAATDYGTEPVAGRLVCIGRDSMTIERDGPQGAPVRVHCPREGFHVAAADN